MNIFLKTFCIYTIWYHRIKLNIAIATLVLSAADIDEAQAITIGIVEVATSLTLSVPIGILSMGITGMPEEEKLD